MTSRSEEARTHQLLERAILALSDLQGATWLPEWHPCNLQHDAIADALTALHELDLEYGALCYARAGVSILGPLNIESENT